MSVTSWLFLFVFIVITALNITGETVSNKLLIYVFKPLIMILLIGWVIVRRPDWESTKMRWLLIGMIFALLGDVFLMIREIDLFGPGLGAFLVMQVCYIVTFWHEIRASKQRISQRRIALILIPFVAYGGGFLIYLNGPFHRMPGTAGLWGSVLFYVVCLCSMAVMASLRRGAVSAGNYWQVLVGAILFVLSDSFIALNKFALPFAGASVAVMATYAAAQYLIVTGVVTASFTTLFRSVVSRNVGTPDPL